MLLTAPSLAVALALSATPGLGSAANTPAPPPVGISEAVKSVPAGPVISLAKPPALEAWMVDAAERRPAALPVFYGTLGALNALDVYSTRRAINTGAYEANPLVRHAARTTGTLLAVKAASTAAAIYFSERAWKKNKKGAVIVMAIVNGVTAAVVAHNLRNTR